MKDDKNDFAQKLKAGIVDRIDVVREESAESDYTFAHKKVNSIYGKSPFTKKKKAANPLSPKITKVEYDKALKNRPPEEAYQGTDYIKKNVDPTEYKSPPRFRAMRAHKTSVTVVLSFLIFELRALPRSKAWREKHFSAVLKLNAKRLYNRIIEIQGLFIKYGQLISMMSFAIPEEFREELEALQDRVPQRPIDSIVKRIEADLGKPLDQIFSHFNTTAMAAASLAQVHEATLLNGERVAVKVQHIGIEKEIKADLKTFRQIVRLFDFFFEVRGLKEAEEQVNQAIMEELSYLNEADHVINFGKNFRNDNNVKVPWVHRKLCSEHVLTMEFVEGIKANDYRALDRAGINRKLVAKRIVEAYCKMVFNDGLIHGDPHPGNILVNPDASLTFLDFGSMVQLSPQLKQGTIDLMWGGITRNTTRIIRGLRKVKYINPAANDSTVAKIVDYAYEYILDGGASIDNFTLDDIQIDRDLWKTVANDLQHLDITYEEIKETFQLPQDVMLMSRVMMLLAGLCHELHPQLKPFDVISPYLQRYIFTGSGDWQQTVKSSAISSGLNALKTIESARLVIDKASKGDLEINVQDHRKTRFLHYYLFQQFMGIFSGFVGGGFAYFAWMQGEPILAGIAAIVGLLFIGSSHRSVREARNLRR